MCVFLSNDFSEFGFGSILLFYGDVDRGDGFFAIKATTLHHIFVVGAVVCGAFAYCCGRAKWELVAGAGGIEYGLVGFSDRLLGRIVRQLLDGSLLVAVFLQEAVEFLAG